MLKVTESRSASRAPQTTPRLRLFHALAAVLVVFAVTAPSHAQDDTAAPQAPAAQVAQQLQPDTAGEAQPPAVVALERLPLGQGSDSGAAADQDDQSNNASNDSRDAGAGLLQTLGALGLVLAAVFATRAMLLRSRGRSLAPTDRTAGAEKIELVDRLGIGAQRQVVLLRVAGRLLVVGDSPAGLQTLSEFPATTAPVTPAAQAPAEINRIDDEAPADAPQLPVAAPTMTAADIDSLLAGLRERREAKHEVAP